MRVFNISAEGTYVIHSHASQFNRPYDRGRTRIRPKNRKNRSKMTLKASCRAMARKGATALAGCWTRVRRKFFESLESSPRTAAWIMRQLQHRQRIVGPLSVETFNSAEVRHRLLILERLLNDLIAEPAYANGNKSRIAQVTIEVNRDLREMSGKSAKEIE